MRTKYLLWMSVVFAGVIFCIVDCGDESMHDNQADLHEEITSTTYHGSENDPVNDMDRMRPNALSNLMAPSNLVISTNADGTRLQWDADLGSDAEGFFIYRSASSKGPFETVGYTTERAYVDGNPPDGEVVYYAVATVDSQGNQSSGLSSAWHKGTSKARYSKVYAINPCSLRGPFKIKPFLMNVRSNDIGIMWKRDLECVDEHSLKISTQYEPCHKDPPGCNPTSIECKCLHETPYLINPTVIHTGGAELNRRHISGLKPNTTYYYVVDGINKMLKSFRTTRPVGSKSSFKFTVFGDTRLKAITGGGKYGTQEARSMVMDRMQADDPLFVLHLGDFVYSGRCHDHISLYFNNVYYHLIDREWGGRAYPMYPVYGNHEFMYMTSCALNVPAPNPYRRFGPAGTRMDEYLLPPPGFAADGWDSVNGGVYWYSYDVQNVHIVVMHTGDIKNDKELSRALLSGNQWKFVSNDLQAAYQKKQAGEINFIFVAMHYPVYSNKDDYDVLTDLYENMFRTKGVDAVFTAHVHDYQRLKKDGLHYYVLGGGGAPVKSTSYGSKSASGAADLVVGLADLSYLLVEINKDVAVLRGKKVTSSGAPVFDTVSIRPPPPKLPDVRITNISFSPSAPSPQTSVKVKATIKNFGNTPTPAGVAVGVGIKIDGKKLGAFFVKDASGKKKSLAAGESYTGKSNVNWKATAGKHTFKAHADDVNRFKESNENNNILTKALQVNSGLKPPNPPTRCGKIKPGQGLGRGKLLNSCDGRFRLVLQNDGNLVLYKNGVKALWSSKTNGKPSFGAYMRSDGNFVIFTQGAKPLWSSNTAGNQGAWLAIQNDGNVVIYNNGKPLWATHTSGN